MVTYEVRIDLEPGLVQSFVTYMTGKHIPDVLRTGCFTAAHFERAAEGAFRTRYSAASRADLERYLGEHAGAMREDFAVHFPAGVIATRVEWELVQGWP